MLDILVQCWRDKKATKKFFRKLLKGLRYVPRVIITDKLKSYSPPCDEIKIRPWGSDNWSGDQCILRSDPQSTDDQSSLAGRN